MESLRAATESIRAHGFRSLLTIVGIGVGVAAVVAVVALIETLQNTVTEQFADLGGNGLTIASFTPLERSIREDFARLTRQDLARIAGRIDGVASITPMLYASESPMVDVRHGGRSALAPLRGTTPSYQDVYRAYPAVGRFISHADDQGRRRICVMGDRTRTNLGLDDAPVGEYVEIAGEWLRVVGVMAAKGDVLGMSQDDYVLVPYQTLAAMMGDAPLDMVIQLELEPDADPELAQDRITQLLRRAHGLKPGDEDDFVIQSADQVAAAFDQLGSVVTAVAGGTVGVSLLVGGIGIMNIMLVSVTERTREIGIQKALGATRRYILVQFLVEALGLALLGGVFGLALGYGFGALVAAFIPGLGGLHLPMWAVVVAVGFSAGVGVAFGLLPAMRAARLHPVEALRYE